MKHLSLTIIAVFLFSSYLLAASGDVSLVNSHTNTQLTWYGSYSQNTQFPDDSKEYQQILMDFTLGCSTGGCSHWDYTVSIEVGKPTGVLDSTVASYDTISTSPLVLDTNWNAPFEIIDWYELGRMITPYGNYMDYGWAGNSYGYDETWNQTWYYDVSNFEPLLHGDVPVRVFFSGWPQAGRGFSADVNFRYVEGVPSKRITNIQKVYGGGTYSNSTQFETDILPAKSFAVNASKAEMRFIVSGHGQDGEFTPITYSTYANNTLIRTEDIWRDDCSENPLSPQGGTWIFNRANWCPGDDVEEHWFEMTPYIQGGNLDINVDFEAYSPSAASYIISAYLFEYEEINRLYDVSVERILTPSISNEEHTISTAGSTSVYDRYTATLCANPEVSIINKGNANLTYCQIEYGVIGGASFYYEWTGNLKYGESEVVTLPLIDWSGLDVANPIFFAEANYPNNLVDQFSYNNRKETSFNLPRVFADGNLTFRLRTNNQAQETSYTIKNDEGAIIFTGSNFPNVTNNDEALTLSFGCYLLEVLDTDNYFMDNTGGDGLSWWLNTQNGLESSGYFEIRQTGGGRLVYFNPDFGHKISYQFLVGDSLQNQGNPPVPSAEPLHAAIEEIVVDGETYYHMADSGLYFSETKVATSIEELLSIKDTRFEDGSIAVYPNPNHGQMTISINSKNQGEVKMYVYNSLASLVSSKMVPLNLPFTYNLEGEAKGIYFLKFEQEGVIYLKKIEIL